MVWANGPTPLYPPSPQPFGPWGGGIKEILGVSRAPLGPGSPPTPMYVRA